MKGMGGGMQQLMRQANQMQAKMKKLQEELSSQEFNGSAGGGAVNIIVNGDQEILTVNINKDVVEAGDIEMLQDMILAAANEAIKTAKETSQKEMDKITGGVGGMPGLF